MTLIELLVLVNRKLEMGLEPNRTEPLNAKKNPHRIQELCGLDSFRCVIFVV